MQFFSRYTSLENKIRQSMNVRFVFFIIAVKKNC